MNKTIGTDYTNLYTTSITEGTKEIKIDIIPTISATPKNPIDRLRAFLLAKKITVMPESPKPGEPSNVAEQIKILPENDSKTSDLQTLITILSDDKPKSPLVVKEEPLVRLAVLSQNNLEACQQFMTSLRARTPDLIPHPNGDYPNNDWYDAGDLVKLAEKWHLPFVTMGSNHHYKLVLKTPEATQNGYRILVYDPQKGNEIFIPLQNWDSGNIQNSMILNTIRGTEASAQDFIDNNYNLSLYGDQDIASDPSVLSAKVQRVQYDAYNCDPACLYAATLRSGAQKQWNTFKFSGKEQLAKDTGLQILTREEIIQSVNPT